MRSQGSQGCQKMCQHLLNLNLEILCAKIEPKFLKNCQNWKKNHQKKHVFLEFFQRLLNFASILAHKISKFEFSGCWHIFWYPWDLYGHVNSGDTRVLIFFVIFCDGGAALTDFFSLLWKRCPMSTLSVWSLKKCFCQYW